MGPTAWALLALGHCADRAEMQMSLGWLEGAYAAIHGAASLALRTAACGVWAACSAARTGARRTLLP